MKKDVRQQDDSDIKKNRIKDISSEIGSDEELSSKTEKSKKNFSINPVTLSLAIIAVAIIAAFIILKIKRPDLFTFGNNEIKKENKDSLQTLPSNNTLENKF